METRILDVIGRIYDAATSRDTWHGILEEIPDLAGGEAANLLIASPQSGEQTVISPRTDDAFIENYFTDWVHIDPTFPTTVMAPVGKVVTLADTGHEAFLASDFYHDIWKRSGHAAERMRSNVIMNSDIQIGFGLSPYMRNDEITSHMCKVYVTLLPHMIRSVEMHWRMHRLELERSIAMSGSDAGVVVVNSDGRVLLADGLAEEILSRGAPLGIRKGILSARFHADTASILGMIDSCVPRKSGYHLRGGSAEISYPDCPALNIAIMPVTGGYAGFALDVDANAQPAAIVILEDLAMRRNAQVGRLCQTHGLTEREAEVALAALAGGSRLDIAESLGVSDATVRTHLSRIYEKLGVKRMGELVRFLQQDGFAG